jgi:hypothetical protein
VLRNLLKTCLDKLHTFSGQAYGNGGIWESLIYLRFCKQSEKRIFYFAGADKLWMICSAHPYDQLMLHDCLFFIHNPTVS